MVGSQAPYLMQSSQQFCDVNMIIFMSILQMRKLRLGSELARVSIADKGHCRVCTHVPDPRAWHLGAEPSDPPCLSVFAGGMADSVTAPPPRCLGRGQVSWTTGCGVGESKAGGRLGLCLEVCLFKSRAVPCSLGGRKAAQLGGGVEKQTAGPQQGNTRGEVCSLAQEGLRSA